MQTLPDATAVELQDYEVTVYYVLTQKVRARSAEDAARLVNHDPVEFTMSPSEVSKPEDISYHLSDSMGFFVTDLATKEDYEFENHEIS